MTRSGPSAGLWPENVLDALPVEQIRAFSVEDRENVIPQNCVNEVKQMSKLG